MPVKQWKDIKLKCTKQSFPEFPDLLFGQQIDSNIAYFDATSYLNLRGDDPRKYLDDFFNKYEAQIATLCKSYNIAPDDICKINEESHELINGNFIYLFLSYTEPNFLAYICDRIDELFSKGFIVSDTYILSVVKARIPRDYINQIYDNEDNQ